MKKVKFLLKFRFISVKILVSRSKCVKDLVVKWKKKSILVKILVLK